jgi:hypothetical protein
MTASGPTPSSSASLGSAKAVACGSREHDLVTELGYLQPEELEQRLVIVDDE